MRRLKVAPRKAKPVAEINSGIKQITTIMYSFSGLGKAEEAPGHPRGNRVPATKKKGQSKILKIELDMKTAKKERTTLHGKRTS
ncbi:hypothetical protein [Sutcliffiella sp. FSL R7-0096]|uniref:hypothetical protein n=1 Tax=Sutcliffiella sp. FSL R7-0096 TaxID=2921670 RepID=UPI003159A511